MKTDKLTNKNIRQYIPNVLTEVAGETPLAEKLAPFIDSARIWLETEYLGPDDFLSEAHNDYALRILVAKAMADAVPSLDLVVTPTGMAVVNTDSMAPASKERVERLINSLREQVRKSIPTLLDFCRYYEAWQQSERGQYFISTFLNYPPECYGIRELENLSYEDLRLRAMTVERELADRYLGRQFMDKLRTDYSARTVNRGHPLVGAMISSVLSLIAPPDGGHVMDQNRLWHAAHIVLNELKFHPDYKQLWESEMGDQFNNQGFVNDIKGGFYF